MNRNMPAGSVDGRSRVAYRKCAPWRAAYSDRVVMPGLVPGIPTRDARCLPKRDGRDIGERSDAVLQTAMPGHDVSVIQSEKNTLPQAARRRESIEPPLADEMRREGQRPEHRHEGAVADIEPARIGAEGRHDHPAIVG